MPASALIHMTAAYSNAVLVAILPHVSDFAQRLGLPISTPITVNQVAHFAPPPHTNEFEITVLLTNRYWFGFDYGNLAMFRSPDNWFTQQDFDHVEQFVGKDNMTTNEAIELSRSFVVKLGYKLADFDMDSPPTRLEGLYDFEKIGHIPFCQVVWESPKGETNILKYHLMEFDVDMQRKQVVGMDLFCRKLERPPPRIDIVPELEPDLRKHPQGRTNAPSHMETE